MTSETRHVLIEEIDAYTRATVLEMARILVQKYETTGMTIREALAGILHHASEELRRRNENTSS